MHVFESNSEDYSASVAALVTLVEKSVRGMDEKLGYHGKDRFVLFYYEPSNDEVIWQDSHSYGVSTGAEWLFFDELSAIADRYNVDLGSGGSHDTHVLLIDRVAERVCFVRRNEAFRFLSSVATKSPQNSFGTSEEVASLASKVEITQESIAELTHHNWEGNGTLEGRASRDRLQAEAQFGAIRWPARRLM